MSFSTVFIRRPVATLLLTVALLLAGGLSFSLLPVAPLPQVDFPYIVVNAAMPGASPETMASSVATPLERALGRISGIVEMTSSSTLGNTQVVLQFDLERNIDGAAREVQAAINTAMSLLPTGMPRNPSYRKANPADMPIMILSLTSDTLSRGQLYDLASTVLAQKIAQAEGVGQVSVGGSSLPAVRVDLNPDALNQHGLALDDVRQAISDANSDGPKGAVEQGSQHWQIDGNDQLRSAAEFIPLIIRHNSLNGGQVLRLGDVAEVSDSVENVRNAGFSGGLPAVLLIITRQPAANIIAATDAIHALLPALRETLGPAVKLKVMDDRSPNIRASLHEAEFTLMVSVALVILVVFAFLRNARATLIPSVAVPVSLIGTFVVMYLCNFSLNNLSLMALIIATGFVVDDAIVMLENIARRIEEGESPLAAALKGASEVGFTVLSMSLSLVAVFIPLLLMGGIPGRLFREFAVTLSAAVLISLLVSLTLTPMLCAKLLQGKVLQSEPAAAEVQSEGRFARLFAQLAQHYRASLVWALDHSRLMLVILLSTIVLNFYLFAIVPKTLFPQQDSGRLRGQAVADQSISFQALQEKLGQFRQILAADPAVANVAGFSGGGGRGSGGGGANTGSFFITLKPIDQREPMPVVASRLRKELAKVAGATLYLNPGQDLRIGGREGNAQYQFSLKSDDLDQLRAATPRVEAAMRQLPELVDVSGDEQNKGLQTRLVIDRTTAARYGVDIEMISALLNNSFGQRQVSTIYNPLNQYRVVMEVGQAYQSSPDILEQVYVISSDGARVPVSTFARIEPSNAPLAVNHLGQFAATTFSFNLATDIPLETAQAAILKALQPLHLPVAVQASFAGTAGAAQDTQSDMPVMILAALLAVYIVLGMLYESYVHPLTIISTLPSAGVGALLALLLCRTELSLIALIGIILLIGIVKKNAILMIDFALDAERRLGMSPREAILEACVKRFRPIMMTSLAALLGALPLLFGTDGDAELRRPLGITIVGGLIGSQLLTLYTTPVVYLYLDRLRHWALRRWHGRAKPLPLELP
ncbi:MAG: multidrug efflux RND transporter permease subunit [Pseudomonas sp.]|uniref:multidrug efflux RND transporter permease subunit n=1 Tax=Pseudomonas sp. TaxID=306 RepID=UPI002735B332|nr:multidrug efflux RND transporter permease subunit [Pseudomonas sp.]MDP3847846.1 multidrug efflux RND transporter permease subunit [Pseudomonas sp.]